jgi:NADH-quinone oxidoreductase subunit J
MSVVFIVFVALAVLAVAGAINLIAQRHPIHSALSLIVVMVALAGEYLLLGAEFIAAVQIIVYAGAIMVLFVFVIMLLNAGLEERTNLSRIARWLGLPVAAILLAELAWAVRRGSMAAGNLPSGTVSTSHLSTLLFRDYVFPFELTSVLILVAIMGAIALAKRED